MPFLAQGEVAVEVLGDHRLQFDQDRTLWRCLRHENLRDRKPTYGHVTYAGVTNAANATGVPRQVLSLTCRRTFGRSRPGHWPRPAEEGPPPTGSRGSPRSPLAAVAASGRTQRAGPLAPSVSG